MATGRRLKGNEGFYLSLAVGAGTPTVLGDDVKGWELTSEAKDDSDMTFAEAATGLGANWTLTLTAIVSFDAGSLWSFLWENPGEEFDVVLAPRGNTTATATDPHFTGTFKLALKPGANNEASQEGSGAEFEVELTSTDDVLLDRGV